MAIKHNQQIPKNHFHKDWQRRVRTHFDQPGRKSRRRAARVTKAARVAPRPVDRLRPVVRCPTIKYNRRVRPGRGFSLAELKEAGIPRKLANTVGIAVDPRRQNLSEESLKTNVERLQEYKKRLILFPRRNGKTKSGDASAEDVKAAKKGENIISSTSSILPIDNRIAFEEGPIANYKPTENAYRLLRDQRAEQRNAGARAKRAAAKEDEAAAKKK
jgi:large subunit ribosomal protein L13e